MAKETTNKKKTPTAQKRMIQNKKKKLINKQFKSKVRTVVRHFEKTLTDGDQGAIQQGLADVFSMMDKGVKRGIYKLNKARRTKSRMTARACATK